MVGQSTFKKTVTLPLGKKATVYEVAKLAGVSTATVARAFNKKGYISEDSKNKIFEASKMLGYKANPLAKGLNGGKTNSLVLLWSLGYPVLPQNVFGALMTDARNHGYQLQLMGVLESPAEYNRVLDDCLLRGIDGAMVCTDDKGIDENAESLLTQFKSAVLVVNSRHSFNVDQIVWNRASAIREALVHCRGTGRKKPGFIGNFASNKRKVDAFITHACEIGFSIDKDVLIDIAGDSNETFTTLFEKYFDSGGFSLDAVFASNDERAAIIMRVLAKKGIRVPDDVAVIGFDNSPLSGESILDLATVDRNHAGLGREMQRLLYARFENPKAPFQTATVDMRFVLRGSAFGASSKKVLKEGQ